MTVRYDSRHFNSGNYCVSAHFHKRFLVQHPQNFADKIWGVFLTCVSGCGQPDVPGLEIVFRVTSDLFHSILK